MKKSSIALIGFMGTGKTAVGRLLAQETGKAFLELDALIEERAGTSIAEIFRREGEIAFREKEIAAVREVTGRPDTVIACGGGVVLNTINTERLRTFCHIVCLTASPEAVIRRCSDDDTRPLLAGPDRMQIIQQLLRYRRPFYTRAADIMVGTSRLNPDGVVKMIMRKLETI